MVCLNACSSQFALSRQASQRNFGDPSNSKPSSLPCVCPWFASCIPSLAAQQKPNAINVIARTCCCCVCRCCSKGCPNLRNEFGTSLPGACYCLVRCFKFEKYVMHGFLFKVWATGQWKTGECVIVLQFSVYMLSLSFLVSESKTLRHEPNVHP